MASKLASNCFAISNYNGKAVLFRTDDVAINKLTFKIINLTGQPLLLKGGEPVPAPDNLSSAVKGSTFSFDFEAMLADEVVAGLKLALPENWAAVFSPGSFSMPPSWSLVPAIDLTININEEIVFEIENIKCSDTSPGNFEVMYRNIPGYSDLVIPVLKHLDILNPPDPQKKTLPLKDGYINPIHPIAGQAIFDTASEPSAEVSVATEAVPIYITYDSRALIENGFTYILTNTSKDPLAGDSTAAEPPVLYISFVFGEADYAITTQNLADNNISINVDAKLQWQTSAHIGGSAYWRFLPQSPRIMDGLETVYFPIKKIITPLNVQPDDISVMYIQLNNIPGYNDAVYTVQMQKKTAEAVMEKLESDRRVINYGENIKLTWVSSLAKRVTIEYETRDKERIILDSEKGEIKLNGTNFLLPVAPSAEYTVIRATAYDNSPSTNSREITITVNQPQATIKTFTGNPQLLNLNSKVDVTLNWETENTQKLILTTPEGQHNVTGKTGLSLRLTEAFTFTLEAWSYGTHFPAPTRAWRKVFVWQALSSIPLGRGRNIMQAQPPTLFDEKTERVYTLNSNANNIYNINSNTSRMEQTLPGLGMALSQNGTKLFSFIADGGFHTAIMFDVNAGVATQKASIALTYEYVRRMLVLPDLTKLFCTVIYEHRGKLWENYLVQINVNAGSNTMALGPRTLLNEIKDFPGNMIFNGDASKLYVIINTDTLAIIRTGNLGMIKQLKLPAANPSAMVSTKSAGKLYIAFQAANLVAMVDTVNDTITNTIAIEGGPANIILSPNDRYLCIACFNSDKVVVMDTDTDQVVSDYPIDGNPLGLCFNKDGKVLFVSGYCYRSLTLIDLANHEVVQPQLNTGLDDGNPYAVTAVDDGAKCKVYVTKESWSQRTHCAGPTHSPNNNISVFSIQIPANLKPE